MLVELLDSEILATPGEPLTCAITVTNNDDRTRTATLRVLGVPTEDSGLTTVQLAAGERTVVRVEVLMPVGSPGGVHPYRVEVLTDDGTTSTVRGEVHVPDSAMVHMTLSPSGINGNSRGELRVSIHNRSTQSATLSLSGQGDDHRIRFRFRHNPIHVSPGERVNVPVKITSRRHMAGDPVTRRFTVRARGAGVPLHARGTFRQTPVFDRNLSKVMAVFLVMMVWASAVGVGLAVITNRQDILSAIGFGDDEPEPGADGDGTDPDGTTDPDGDGSGSDPDGGDVAAPTPEAPGGAPRVTGIVKDADGNGLSGVDVTVSAASLGARPSTIAVESFQGIRGKRLGPIAPDRRTPIRVTALSGDDGNYSVAISSAGAYYLDYRVPGFQTAKHLVVFGNDLAPVGLDVTLQRATGTLTGRVVPPSNARILVSDGVSRYETVADAVTGVWEVSGVSVPGEFVVTATLPTGESQATVVQVGTSTGGSSVDVGVLSVASGLTSLSGLVCDESAASFEGIGGATVTVAAGDATFTTTTADGVLDVGGIDGAGAFVLNGLPVADTYDLTVGADGYITVSRRLTSDGFHSECIGLTISTGSLVGTVAFDKPGPATSGISIKAISAANQYATTVGEKNAEGTGAFAIDGMAPGEYVVTVSRPDIGTIVRQIQIVPPGTESLAITVTQVDTDASLSATVRFTLRGDGMGFRSAASDSLSAMGVTVTVGGIDLDDVLTNAVAADGTLNQTVQLPLGRHRVQITGNGHETIRLPFVVISDADEHLVDLLTIDRPGSDPAAKFNGELRPLATLNAKLISGLDPGSETLVTGTALLRKVISDTSEDPARGLDEYGTVDTGSTNAITMALPAPTFELERRLPSGHYILGATGTAPDFHWLPEGADAERFRIDLRSDAQLTQTPDTIVYPRFPKLDITIDSTADAGDKAGVYATITKVVRTTATLASLGGAAAVCTTDFLDGDATAAETVAAAAATTVEYDTLPAPDGGTGIITIPARSIEIDRASPPIATVVVCRDGLEPTVQTTAALAPNTAYSADLIINPATVIQLLWDDHGTLRSDTMDGFTVVIDGVTLTYVGDGTHQTGEVDPRATPYPVTITLPNPPAHFLAPPATTAEAGDVTPVTIPTSPAVLRVPMFVPFGESFANLVVDIVPTSGPATPVTLTDVGHCATATDDTATIAVNQCDFGLQEFSGLTYGPPSVFIPTLPTITYLGFNYEPGTVIPYVEGQLFYEQSGRLVHWIGGGTTEDGSLVFPNGKMLRQSDITALALPVPLGEYTVDARSPILPGGVYAANAGTLDITPDKRFDVRTSDPLHLIRRPLLEVQVTDQVGTAIPTAAEAALPALDVVAVQDGVTKNFAKAGPATAGFLVDPTDLLDQLADYNAVTPRFDPTGPYEVVLVPDATTPVAPGAVTLSVDLTGEDRFEYPTSPPPVHTVADTTTGAVETITLVRFTTFDITVAGDLDDTENDPLPGATVTLAVVLPDGTTDHTGTIGEYASAYDAGTDTITWSPLVLTAGAATFTTLELGVGGNLRFRNIRYPGCPPMTSPPTAVAACNGGTFTLTASHPEFDTDDSATVTVDQGDAEVISLLVTDPILRLVSGTFSTTEDRALVNTAVCLTATPTKASSKAPVVRKQFSFLYGRGEQTWSLSLVPRTKYEITSVAATCPDPTDPADPPPVVGNYTNGTTIEINAKQGGTGKGTGSGPIPDQLIQFTAGGATVTGTVYARHPSGGDSTGRAFTGCGTDCPTIELFAATDSDFSDPIGSVAYTSSTGGFVITDSATDTPDDRIIPASGNADQMYKLRISGTDLVTQVFDIGTLIENQPNQAIPQGTPSAPGAHPLLSVLQAYTVDLLVQTGGTPQEDIQMTLQRTGGATVLDQYWTNQTPPPPLACTTSTVAGSEGKCVGLVLLPGTYTVTGPAGASISGISGDHGTPDGFLDLDRPVGTTPLTVTVDLGFGVDLTVTDKNSGATIVGAPIFFNPGALTCTTITDGTCTIGGASNTTYTVTATALTVQTGGTYKVKPNGPNNHGIQVQAPVMTFSGVANGTVVSVTAGTTQTCTISGGTCTITLGSSVSATTTLTAKASREGTASTTTFQWRTSRAVTLNALVDRTRTANVRDSAGTAIIDGAPVRLTPPANSGTARTCNTDGTGACPLSGLWAVTYGTGVDGFATTTPTSTTISIDATSATPITLTVSTPTITFTNMVENTVVTLSGTTATGTCTATDAGTCTIQLPALTPAAESVTALASFEGTVSETVFTWAARRSVEITTLTARQREVYVHTATTDVNAKLVTFTPTGATGGDAVECTTAANGRCTLSGLWAGTYDITVADGTTVPATTVISTAKTDATIDLTYVPK